MIDFPLLPSGQPLPLQYRWFRAHGLKCLTPWHFYDSANDIAKWREAYQKETGRDAWPYAYRQDRGEVAAFPLVGGQTKGTVIILDNDSLDQWPGGGPRRPQEKFSTFADWLFEAMRESIGEWMTEQELADFLDE